MSRNNGTNKVTVISRDLENIHSDNFTGLRKKKKRKVIRNKKNKR